MPDFGEPSPSFVPEAAWLVFDEHGFWPTWEQAIEVVSRLVPCDPDEAETRVLASIETGEVRARFDDDGDWLITVDDETADAIARRYLDTTLERKENHGQQA
jgi:hypothetical protein